MDGATPEFRLACVLTKLAMSATRGWHASGLEGVPRSGPLIVAANHISMVDPPLLGMSLSPVRWARFVGKEELFRFPPLGLLLRRLGCIKLDRRGDVRAVRSALEVLERGGCMAMFPEGTRSRTGQPGKPKPGVALLARQARAPVVPARVSHTRTLLGPEPFTIRFGAPIPPPPIEADSREADRAYAELVMARIAQL
ncbi:MAG: 1-acyl-sn-glycerol-3-phosphate acyltransferase [Elusimicrobia bacterium]|nr:1-acyl-sn-glycerol-3-phosphate acyltransferase [Elusimicrobiota bacterium]